MKKLIALFNRALAKHSPSYMANPEEQPTLTWMLNAGAFIKRLNRSIEGSCKVSIGIEEHIQALYMITFTCRWDKGFKYMYKVNAKRFFGLAEGAISYNLTNVFSCAYKKATTDKKEQKG